MRNYDMEERFLRHFYEYKPDADYHDWVLERDVYHHYMQWYMRNFDAAKTKSNLRGLYHFLTAIKRVFKIVKRQYKYEWWDIYPGRGYIGLCLKSSAKLLMQPTLEP